MAARTAAGTATRTRTRKPSKPCRKTRSIFSDSSAVRISFSICFFDVLFRSAFAMCMLELVLELVLDRVLVFAPFPAGPQEEGSCFLRKIVTSVCVLRPCEYVSSTSPVPLHGCNPRGCGPLACVFVGTSAWVRSSWARISGYVSVGMSAWVRIPWVYPGLSPFFQHVSAVYAPRK